MDKVILKGRGITGGTAEGDALVTDMAFSFGHGLDTMTGELTDTEIRDWLGQNVKGKVLVFPYGKGTSSGGLYIMQAVKRGNAPAAVINVKTDPICATGFILAEMLYDKKIPIVDQLQQNLTEIIKTGDRVKVDGDRGVVEVISEI